MREEGVPPAQYLGAEFVLEEMGEHGARRVTGLSVPQILLLAILAGALITAGAIFSLLLGASVSAPGPQRLLEGLGFSTGFFFVILISAILPLRYQVLEAQPIVTDALEGAGRARTVRRSIELTPFGADFCDRCLPLDTAEFEAVTRRDPPDDAPDDVP